MTKYKTVIFRNGIDSNEYPSIHKEYYGVDISIGLENYINETDYSVNDMFIKAKTIFNEHENHPVQMDLLISPSDLLIERCIKNNISIDYSLFRGGHQRKRKKTYCYFSINGEEFDPISLLSNLEVECFGCYKKGDNWINGRKRNKSNLDICKFDLSDNTISELFDKIMYVLKEKKELLCQIKTDNDLSYVAQAVVYLKDNKEFVDMYPSKEAMAFFYEIGAFFDFDIYYL